MEMDQAIPISLIMNELITNILKYAFPNREEDVIEVSLYDSELTVKDMVQKKKDDKSFFRRQIDRPLNPTNGW